MNLITINLWIKVKLITQMNIILKTKISFYILCRIQSIHAFHRALNAITIIKMHFTVLFQSNELCLKIIESKSLLKWKS